MLHTDTFKAGIPTQSLKKQLTSERKIFTSLTFFLHLMFSLNVWCIHAKAINLPAIYFHYLAHNELEYTKANLGPNIICSPCTTKISAEFPLAIFTINYKL
jgi:hypothetical protein